MKKLTKLMMTVFLMTMVMILAACGVQPKEESVNILEAEKRLEDFTKKMGFAEYNVKVLAEPEQTNDGRPAVIFTMASSIDFADTKQFIVSIKKDTHELTASEY